MPVEREKEDSDLRVYLGRDLGRVGTWDEMGWVDSAPAAGPLPQLCSWRPPQSYLQLGCVPKEDRGWPFHEKGKPAVSAPG